MRIEQRQGPKVSRRDFLKLLVTGAILGTAAFDSPVRVPVEKEKDKTIFPGWIEANTKSNFLKQDKGHFHFLREAVFSNPILEELTRNFFKHLNARLEKKDGEEKRVNLGDALSYTIEKAHAHLSQIDQSKISPRTNLTLESIHAGLFVFAAGFMGQWFSNSDLERLGVSLEGYRDADDYFVHLERNVYPRLFSKEIPQSDQFMNGEDRSAHFAQHLFIAFEYLYSKHFELGVHASIPNFLKPLIFLFSDKTREGQARALSRFAGEIWEFSNLLGNLPIGKDQKDIHEGPFDLMVDSDYKGNRLGSEAGIVLFNLGRMKQGVSEITSFIREKLNDKRFHKFETEPKI